MYRRPKFLEILLEIRQEMAREVDYDVELFTEMLRNADNLIRRKTKRNSAVSNDEEKIRLRRNPSVPLRRS